MNIGIIPHNTEKTGYFGKFIVPQQWIVRIKPKTTFQAPFQDLATKSKQSSDILFEWYYGLKIFTYENKNRQHKKRNFILVFFILQWILLNITEV